MLKKEFFKGQLCDSQLSYEFAPKKEYALPLRALGDELEQNGHFLDIKTPFVLVLQISGAKVSLYSTGKILVKHVNVEKRAETIFHTLIQWANVCACMEKV